MSAPKHTPGPWWASGSDFAVLAGDAEDKPYTRTVAETNVGDMTEPEALANARLIAAAPDMLEALEELAERCGTVSPFTGESSVKRVREAGKFLAALDKAHAAIAKARGQS